MLAQLTVVALALSSLTLKSCGRVFEVKNATRGQRKIGGRFVAVRCGSDGAFDWELRRCPSDDSSVTVTSQLRGGTSSESGEVFEDEEAEEEVRNAATECGAFEDSRTSRQDEPQRIFEFEEDAIPNRALSLWRKTPFLTKRFFYASISLVLYTFLLNGNRWPEIFNLEWKKIATGQVWRLFTNFFYFGPLGLNSIISMYFVWTYMGELERMYFKKPYDFAMMIGYGAICLLATTSILGISGLYLGHSLSCYLVYIWSREYEGLEVNVNDMFNLKAELLPWFFVAQSLVLEGQIPVLDIVGIFVGYLYMQLKIRNSLKAPRILRDIFKIPSVAKDYKRFEREFGVENLNAADIFDDINDESDVDSQSIENDAHSSDEEES